MAMRVLIYGSCVSNDIFSFVAHEHQIAAYLPRMSLATAFGPSVPEHLIFAAKKEIESLTHRYWVLNDLEKRLEKVLTTTSYDILLLDFIDERLHLAVAENGALFTRGEEFRRSEAGLWNYEMIRSTSPQHFELWKKGVDAFAKFVDPQKVFINKVFWAAVANDGSQFDEKYVDENNRFLEKLYRHIEINYAFNFITYEPEVFVGDAEHQWEKSPFHYIPRYYAEAMNALNRMEIERIRETKR